MSSEYQFTESNYSNMKFAISFVVLLAFTGALAKDAQKDYEERMEKAEEISMEGLYEFLDAYKNNDSATLKYWTDKIIKNTEEGQQHSEGMMPKMVKVVDLMNGVSKFGFSHVMKGMAMLMDGKRDNESYAKLQACIDWCKYRINRGVNDENLAKAQVKCKEAQDELELMAGTLVESVKALKKDVSNMREINAHVKKVFENNKDAFLENGAEAIEYLKAFRNRA